MKRLIINADDFGMTAGINQAILELGRWGVITSATLMASAEETVAAAEAWLRRPAFGVGCHVVLVDGTPISPPEAIPTLIDPRSPRDSPRFRPTLGAFLRDLLRGRIRESDIEAEAVAQIRRLQQLDVTLTHVDSHKHTHAFPRVLRPLLRAAVLCNVACIRNPFEPEWSIAATGNSTLVRQLQVRALNRQRRYFSAAAEHIGVFTTDGSLGVLATGSLDPEQLRSILEAMPEGAWELVCHPGYVSESLKAAGTRLVDSRETERVALGEVIPEVARHGVSLIDFGQLKAANFAAVM